MSERSGDGDREPRVFDLPADVENEYFLSPEQAQYPAEGKTPTRVLSSHSLAGEDIVLSARPSTDFPADIALSPFTPSEGTQTPPISLPDPTTPPPINTSYSNSSTNQSPLNRIIRPQPQPSAATSSLPGRMRPPRVPQVSLQPFRGTHSRHGRGLSNSDYSFLSALTDGTSDNISATHTSTNMSGPRRRTVSWDYTDSADRGLQTTDSPGGFTNTSTQSTPVSLLQPILNDEIVAPPASIVTGGRKKISATSQSHHLPVQRSRETPTKSNTSSPDRGSQAQRPGIHPVGRFSTFKTENTSHRSSSGENPKGTPLWNPATGTDTGSFVVPADFQNEEEPQTPPSFPDLGSTEITTRVSSGLPLKRYSVEEVLDAYPQEAAEETLLLSQIEFQELGPPYRRFHSSLMPEVPSELFREYFSDHARHLQDEKKDHDSSVLAPKRTKRSSESFADIARKLLDGSPDVKHDGPKQIVHRRDRSTDVPIHADDKLYEAAETRLGDYANTAATFEHDEELGNETTAPQGWKDQHESPKTSELRRYFSFFRRRAREDIGHFREFLGPHKRTLQKELSRILRWILVPMIAIATLMYYVMGNPPTGYNYPGATEESAAQGPEGRQSRASTSWWLLFGARQIVTLEIARLTQLIVIDFLTLRTKYFPRLLGPSISLVFVQAKGWPVIVLTWAVWDFVLLYGDRRLCHHWGYWQSRIGMMNVANPHGDITSDDLYGRILISAFVVGMGVCIKRSVMGQIVGKRVVGNYRGDLARLMQKLIVLSDVSRLSTKLNSKTDDASRPGGCYSLGEGKTKELGLALEVAMLGSGNQADSFDYSDAMSTHSKETKKFTHSAKMDIMELLEEWEEPELQESNEEEVTMGTILQFRRALDFISGEYPFSLAFGNVRTRDDCVTSAQVVFECLMAESSRQFLSFDVLCVVAKDSAGNIDRNKVRQLIRVFRPNRNGHLSKLDFVKSVDSVYKALRLLLVSIKNSQQIYRAYETIVNIILFICALFVVMAIIGVDVVAIIIGISSVVVSFAFIIGAASSKYLEGILFVLVRKPYDIGDRVNVASVLSQPNVFGGESSWIIEKVDLYSTTARLGTTRELATFCNGSLAGLRIMNLNRSDKPNIYLNLKFSVESSPQQRQMFKRRMTAFVKERPRQWIKVVDFRNTRVEADLGFVEYVLVIQHREKWQNLAAILTSRGEVFDYAVELQKKLNMNYKAAYVPIDNRRMDQWESSRTCMDFDPGTADDMEVNNEPKKDR